MNLLIETRGEALSALGHRLKTLADTAGFPDAPGALRSQRGMWGYALVWFAANDVIKMWTYRLLRSRGEV